MNIFGFFSALALCAAAHAGPGWEMTSFSTTPQQAPAIVSAIDKWMQNEGKDYPGQVLLQAHEADGSDPATHSVVVLYDSVAQQEAFSQQVEGSEAMMAAWMELMDAFGQNAQQVASVRGAFVKNWGDVNGDDTVWMNHAITTQDPAGVVAAMDGWMSSASGSKAPGQTRLSAVVAGGMGAPSHIVSVGYASQAEMEAWGDSLVNNEDFAQFLEEIRKVSEYHGATMVLTVQSWGGEQTEEVASN